MTEQTKQEFYERAIGILNDRYLRIRKLFSSDDRNYAVFLYNALSFYIEFMWVVELIDFDEYLRLIDEHYVFYNSLFLV